MAPPTSRALAATPSIVVVELFTSEGCSSCPPADDVLTDLLRNQPIPNVTVVGFGEHVDYWDNLGWHDAFSSPAFTARQSDYERHVFHAGSIYTPQAVVDGRFQMVGSDVAGVRRAIVNAATSAKATVSLNVPPTKTRDAQAQMEVNVPAELMRNHVLEVFAGIVEHNLVTKVQRGENGGRVLKHGAVARTLMSAGNVDSNDRTFAKTITLPIEAGWKRSDLQVVAFVQDRTTKAIVGGAAAFLP
jgi:hypothetical protein